ncbi:LLM class flavin-dependent oxidoreductase [Nocardioides sp.]|uniref:LLM class flavin-dependent oxidoreductase n=1 Tax=Nocardioides sp. TaxID=35761 RepID=UPI00199A4E50|nr:LLM class flavin-dependent oxidoreductase [Nocardioides sp.]MBC7274981.1 LLM class flavin-dependent oxidoreductase [Nocardioides sp.]
MKISLWPNHTSSTADILAEAQAADQAGWYGVWVADHYMPNTGTEDVEDGPTHEVWGILPALAATTQNVRIGPLVSPTTIHHPALLANRSATIDHIAGGRFVLGMGAGWQINEHKAYGIDLPSAKVLVDRFEEAIEVTRSLLDKPRTTFEGTYFQLTDAPCEPKPVASPLPILVGAKGPRMLKVVARHADEWNTWGTPESAGAVRAKLLEACEQVGRDPETIKTTTNFMLDLDGANPGFARTQTGSAGELQDLIGRYAAAGFDEFILPTWNLGETGAERIERAAQLKAEVLDPAL